MLACILNSRFQEFITKSLACKECLVLCSYVCGMCWHSDGSPGPTNSPTLERRVHSWIQPRPGLTAVSKSCAVQGTRPENERLLRALNILSHLFFHGTHNLLGDQSEAAMKEHVPICEVFCAWSKSSNQAMRQGRVVRVSCM